MTPEQTPASPDCPMCGHPPLLVFFSQAFCGNDECPVFVWDLASTPAENRADAGFMDVSMTCPACGWTTHNADDVAEGYCGHCHAYTSLGLNNLGGEQPS